MFLHPAQEQLVRMAFNGPARVAGSAGTGKTIVALHRAAWLARGNANARVLLATFYAAADGVIMLAGRDRGYGNAVRIDHGASERTRQLSSAYGHLSRFAPGIVAGAMVLQGDLIGFSGNTGRSTGPHLHFELLSNGKPVNPLKDPATQRGQLAGADLARFRRQMAAALDEREREQSSINATIGQFDGKISVLAH